MSVLHHFVAYGSCCGFSRFYTVCCIVDAYKRAIVSQAVEAKEGVPLKGDSMTQASVTYQCFFRYYDKLAGMTVGSGLDSCCQHSLMPDRALVQYAICLVPSLSECTAQLSAWQALYASATFYCGVGVAECACILCCMCIF